MRLLSSLSKSQGLYAALLWFLCDGGTAIAQKSVGLFFAVPDMASAVGGGFPASAIKGCAEFAVLNPGYNCKYFVREIPNDTEITEHLNSDPSIFHAVMVGFLFSEALRVVALRHPGVRFSLIDASIDNTYPLNCQGITFAEDEAGFLAGVVAGALTDTGIVGVMGNLPIPPVQRYVYGFLNGVKYINPSVTTYSRFNLDFSWANSTLGALNAKEFLSRGVDVFFAAAGGMGSQAIYNVASSGKWVIGVDTDESITTFSNKTDIASSRIFASAMKRIDKATLILLNESVSGQFFSGNKVLDSSIGGVGLSGCSSGLACAQLGRGVVFRDTDAGCARVRKTDMGSLLGIVTSRIEGGRLSTVGNGYLQGLKGQANGTWSDLPSFGRSPPGLQGHTQTFIYDNTILIFGGQTSNGNITNTLYRYNYDAVTWTVVSTITQAPSLHNHGAVFRKSTGEMFVIGGKTSTGALNSDIWRFSLNTMDWSLVATHGGGPGKRDRHSVTIVDDQDVYVWGGHDENAPKNDFWVLNLDSFIWTLIPATSSQASPPPLHSASMVILNNTIYLHGGTDTTTQSQTLWSFHLPTQAWSSLNPSGSQPPPLSRSSMSVLDVRRIILVGGSTGKAAVGGVWIYNAVLDEWSQDVKMSLPYPLQGLTMSVLVQTEYKDACTYGAGFAICTPMNDTVAVVFGGLNPTLGTINDIRVAFIEPEKHPRPLRFPPISILSVGHASAGAGILISLAALVSTAIYRRTAAFRSASPLFLSTYALGAIGAFIGIVLYNLASREFRLCGTALWMFSEGCLMLVAAMVVKNWRTYYIYLRPASLDPNPTSLNDFVLFSVLFIILLINSAAILTFQRLSPYEPTVVTLDEENWMICKSRDMDKWLWVLLSPMMIVLVCGIYVSLQTRNVTSKYNEAGQISLSVCVVTLTMVILLILGNFIRDPSALHLINSLLTSLTICTVLFTHFFTKIYGIISKDDDDSESVISVNAEGKEEEEIAPAESLVKCKLCKQSLKPIGTTLRLDHPSSFSLKRNTGSVSFVANPASHGVHSIADPPLRRLTMTAPTVSIGGGEIGRRVSR